MHLGLLVAIGTATRRIRKGPVRVAVPALGVLVRALQGIKIPVLEPDHAVLPVVAARAPVAVLLDVRLHLLPVLRGVALGTRDRGRVVLAAGMAALAGERRAVESDLVQVQAKAREALVVDGAKGHIAYRAVPPLVFLVAGLALVGARQHPVQALCLGSLPRDLAVAVLAQVGRETAHRRVAVLALLLKVRVRAVPMDRLIVTMRGHHLARVKALLEPKGSATQAQD